MRSFSPLYCGEHASCFRAGSKEETRLAFQETIYWYDFTVRGHRYRRSTQETKLARTAKGASVKLGSVIEGTDPFPSKPSVLSEFAKRFDTWVEDGRLEEKTKKFYRNGWRLLKATPVAGLRVDQITGDFAEQLKFPGSAANANCALRTL